MTISNKSPPRAKADDKSEGDASFGAAITEEKIVKAPKLWQI
jgi:hypothetical protein